MNENAPLLNRLRAVIAATIFTASGAASEAGEAGEASDASAKETSVIEEVIVTARKRSENAMDVPISLTVLDETTMRDNSARSIYDVLELAPGVNLSDDTAGGAQRITIRGTSTTSGSQSVGYYVDDLPFVGLILPINPDVRAFDIERIEVLRGPQGTIFGDGSMGGTVHIVTRDPDPSAFGVHVDAFYGSFGDGATKGGRGMINIPLVEDQLALRMVGFDEDRGGWLDNENKDDANDRDASGYRAKLAYTPSDAIKIVASAWLNEKRTWDAEDRAPDDGIIPPGGAFGETEYDRYSLAATVSLGPGEALYAFGTTEYDHLLTIPAFAGFVIFADIGIEVETHELRYSGSVADRFTYTAGVYARDAEVPFGLKFVADGIPIVDTVTIQNNEVRAVFGEVEYSFSDAWAAALGLRYSKEDLHNFDTQTLIAAQIDADYLLPRFTLNYRPTDSAMFYGSVAKGARSAVPNFTDAIHLIELLELPVPYELVLDADSIVTYELGVKAVLAEGNWTIEAAVYYSDWEDLSTTVPVPGLGGLVLQVNTEGADIAGFDLSMTYVAANLTLHAGMSLVDSEQKADVPNTALMKGDTLPEVAAFMASAHAHYDWPLAGSFDGFNGMARLGIRHVGEREDLTSVANLPSDAMTMADARLGIENDRLGVYLFGANLTDEDGALKARGAASGFAATRPVPRTIGIEVSVRY